MNQLLVMYLLYSFTNLSKEVEDLFLFESLFLKNIFEIITVSLLHDNEKFIFILLLKSLKSENVCIV
jgi:hypothetical protein